jgi:hypothetical protein
MRKCQQKKVAALSNKLYKQCSFKNPADCESLCHLVYWLYIYGEKELAMECIALTHNVPFDINHSIWTFIHLIWGLEMRMLREQGKEHEALEIADMINAHLLTPNKFNAAAEMPSIEERRRSKLTYEDTIRKTNVERHLLGNDVFGANTWRFVALIGMIGNTETGFYPHLNDSRELIEEKIAEYITELSKIG